MSVKVGGVIQRLNLTNWWLLLEIEQRQIIEGEYIFQYSDLIKMGEILPLAREGRGDIPPITTAGLLDLLSMRLVIPDMNPLALIILRKAEEEAIQSGNIFDLHGVYRNYVERIYSSYTSGFVTVDEVISICEKAIAISEGAFSALMAYHAVNVAKLVEMGYSTDEFEWKPGHEGYRRLTMIREKQKDYIGVISLCRQAEEQGWNGDWEKRIARCQQKLVKMDINGKLIK